MIEAIVTLALGLVGSVVWAIRQEGLIKQAEHRLTRSEKEIDEMKIHLKVLDEKVFKELTDIKIALAEIRGALAILNQEG